MVLSFVPSTREGEPLTIEEAAATAAIVEGMKGTHRMLLHGRVNPNQPGDLDGMDVLAQKYKVAAFKTYTQWGPDGKGFFLDDDAGVALIEKARKLGVRNIAVHKGLPFGAQSYEHSTCVDVGRVARRFPDMNFLIYHSGFVAGKLEGAYDASRPMQPSDASPASFRVEQFARLVAKRSGCAPGGIDFVHAPVGLTKCPCTSNTKSLLSSEERATIASSAASRGMS
jgi:hypothetical protein